MNKVLVVLFISIVLLSSFSKASVFVDISERDFDRFVQELINDDNENIVIIESTPPTGRPMLVVYQYMFYNHGFYYRNTRAEKREFNNAKIKVVKTI